MGIFINLVVSKSVTKPEWEAVYEETLQLIKNLPLAERRQVDIHGVNIMCLVKTEEHDFSSLWEIQEEKRGWIADGDLETLKTSEEYFLPRDLIEEDKTEENAGDAMLGALPAYLDFDWDDKRFTHVYRKWGNKTQGRPYHMYLLAVACLIEARLGTKAFIYGDITRGQCKRAVEIANKFLGNKIEMPARCYTDRLIKRVNALELSESDKLKVFEEFYLGTKDAAFGETLKNYFSKKLLDEYWKNRFKNAKIGTSGFDEKVSEYLLWGFEIDKLCEFVNFKDDDGNMLYEKFVTRIMDAKLHLKDKNCADPLKIDAEGERPYSIWTLFAQFGFAGAKNKKVDRYIPIEEVRAALRKGLDGKFDVEAVIDEYLKNEAEQIEINLNGENVTEEQVTEAAKQDAAETFGQLMDRKRAELAESYAKYDINDLEDLMEYENGYTIRPGLAESLGRSRKVLDGTLDEPDFVELSAKSVEEKFRWIVSQNRYILIKKTDWEQIYKNLEKKTDSFARYYSLMRVDSEENNLSLMTRALMINDDLYTYTKELAESIKDSEDT
jgi:hypothetical protein